MRQQGLDTVGKDGDIMLFRFNVQANPGD